MEPWPTRSRPGTARWWRSSSTGRFLGAGAAWSVGGPDPAGGRAPLRVAAAKRWFCWSVAAVGLSASGLPRMFRWSKRARVHSRGGVARGGHSRQGVRLRAVRRTVSGCRGGEAARIRWALGTGRARPRGGVRGDWAGPRGRRGEEGGPCQSSEERSGLLRCPPGASMVRCSGSGPVGRTGPRRECGTGRRDHREQGEERGVAAEDLGEEGARPGPSAMAMVAGVCRMPLRVP